MYPEIIIIVSTLLFSAFFSGIEIAFFSANKLKIEIDCKQGTISGRIYSHFLDKQSMFIGTMLVGNNIALVVYGITMANLIEPFLNHYISSSVAVLIVQTVSSTLLVLFAAEFIPKAIFRINPNKTLNVFAIPVLLMYYLLYIPVYFTIGISNQILKKVIGVNLEENKPVFGKTELDEYIEEATTFSKNEEDIEHEVQIFQNALSFTQTKAREFMIPRNEIVALEFSTSIDKLNKEFIKTGLSKILIYKKSIDNIIGYAHSYALFKNPDSIKNILLPLALLPEAMPANQVLEHLIANKRSIAVVLDEYGGTSGIVTMEDVVEEIFGKIEDEHDKETLTETKINDKKYLFSARLEVDYLNTKYKLNLPESTEYETLAGLIFNYYESIPDKNKIINFDNFDIKIQSVSDNKIEEVELLLKQDEE